jgi:DNA-binding SARP family transcriptional activator
MQSLNSPEQERNAPLAEETAFLVRLLEAGLSSLQQKHYVEGLVMVDSVREGLLPHQSHLIPTLNALTQSYTTYLRAQEELLEAGKRYAQADNERRVQLQTMKSLLSMLKEAPDQPSELLSYSSIASSSRPEVLLCDAGLYITCFGSFAVWQGSKPVALCSSRTGQGILRYLVAQPRRSASIDMLMALFWPEDEAEVAQRKLHIAMSALRRSLHHLSKARSAPILCKNRTYSLNPEINICTDVEEFLRCYQMGRQRSEERVASFERACRLYTGPFLSEDRYADWSFSQREQLAQIYITMCRVLADHYLHAKHYEDAAKWAQIVLKENRCDEAAHRLLMQVYAAQGYRFEVLQQYQSCERILYEELGVSPLPETTHLLQTLLSNEVPVLSSSRSLVAGMQAVVPPRL